MFNIVSCSPLLFPQKSKNKHFWMGKRQIVQNFGKKAKLLNGV